MLSGEVMWSQCMEVSKATLDKALSNTVISELALFWAKVELENSGDPSRPVTL